jgi:hypothetical protein
MRAAWASATQGGPGRPAFDLLGLAFILRASGVAYPATLAAVIGGLGMGIGGPIVTRRLRQIMLANRAGSPR